MVAPDAIEDVARHVHEVAGARHGASQFHTSVLGRPSEVEPTRPWASALS
jgi:hypothetical protein